MRQPFYALVLSALLAAALPSFAQAASCSNANLYGNYMNQAIGGVDIPNNPLAGPFRRLFRVVFDGAGNANITAAYSSFNGFIYGKDQFAGTYTINPDCTAVLNFNLPLPLGFTATFVGVLSADNTELDFALSTAPTSAGGTLVSHLTKQVKQNCDATDLYGSYAFQLQGTIVQPASQAGDFAQVGLLVADGKGGFTAKTTATYNGAQSAVNIAGTYTMDSTCVFMLQYGSATDVTDEEFSHGSITMFGGMTSAGSADLLQISPMGTAVVGSLYQAGGQ